MRADTANVIIQSLCCQPMFCLFGSTTDLRLSTHQTQDIQVSTSRLYARIHLRIGRFIECLYYINIVLNYKTIAGFYLSSNFLPGGINGYTLWNHNQSGCSLHDSHCGAYYLLSSGMDGFLSESGAIFINDNVTTGLLSIVTSSSF